MKRHTIPVITILLTKTTAAQNEVALSYYRLRGLYFLAGVSMRSIVKTRIDNNDHEIASSDREPD